MKDPIKFFSIKKFPVVRQAALDFGAPKLRYRATTKLHGAQGSIYVTPEGEVVPQSRNLVLGEQEDSHGFARWVLSRQEAFKACLKPGFVVYGEWCGPGIQKKVALNALEKPAFACFSVFDISSGHIYPADTVKERYLSLELAPELRDEVFVIPLGVSFDIDWRNCEDSFQDICSLADEVSLLDPWVKERFGIEGPGEGLVLYPEAVLPGQTSNIDTFDFSRRELFSKYVFKVHGEHFGKGKWQSPHRTIELQKFAEGEAFAAYFVTSRRMSQCLVELELQENDLGSGDLKLVQRWMGQDIKKESIEYLKQAGFKWKHVSGAVSQRVRLLFAEYLQ